MSDSSAVVVFTPGPPGSSPTQNYLINASPGAAQAVVGGSPGTIGGLVNGQQYVLSVAALSAVGQGPFSAPSAPYTPTGLPSPPTGVMASAGDTVASVSFVPPVNTGGLALGNYTATASPGGAQVSGSASPLNFTGLTDGTAYTFTVKASNSLGSSVASAASSPVTPVTPLQVPSAPQNVVVTAGNGSASISFSPPATGSPFTLYTVTLSPSGGPFTGASSPIALTGLTNGTAYTAQVQATNATGAGALSASTAPFTPTAPVGFSITTTTEPTGTQGHAYTGSLAAANGVSPYTYYNSTALPGGLSLNASTGAITGTPTGSGTTTTGFYATDSSGTPSYSTSTTVASNEGPGMVQTPGGIATTSSVGLALNGPTVCITTAATYGSTSAPAHNGRGLQSTNSDSFSLQTYYCGPYNGEFGSGPAYINASQETAVFLTTTPKAGSTTFQQWFGTAGYGGSNAGDQDYQAFKAYQYAAGSTILGFGAVNPQTGTNYNGVPQGTALVSGNITVTASQVPCTLYGFCFNISDLGSNYLATPNSVGGVAGTTIENTWAFGSGVNGVCYAYWRITTPGTYAASFNQPSTTPNCYHTTAWMVQGPISGGATTPTKNLNFVIAASGGGTVFPSAPPAVYLALQGQTAASQTTSPPIPVHPNNQSINWAAATAGTYPIASYNVYKNVNGGAFSKVTNTTGLTYADTAATLCVNGTAGSTAPYYPANTYLYYVTAVDTQGNEGPASGTQQFQIYANGVYNWAGDFQNQSTVVYNDTSGAPVGGGQDIKVTVIAPYGESLPYTGVLVTEYNMWVGAFKYLYIDFKATRSGQDWKIYGIRVGDVNIYNASKAAYNILVSSYCTITNGVWVTAKIPLVDFLTDYGSSGAGPAVVQNALYKFAIQDTSGLSSNTWYQNNMYLRAT